MDQPFLNFCACSHALECALYAIFCHNEPRRRPQNQVCRLFSECHANLCHSCRLN